MVAGSQARFAPIDLEQVYWQDIQHSEPLTREAEGELAGQARAGDERARQRLVLANLRFVVSIARQYANCGLAIVELISEGNMGLLEAARRFDGARGTKFITYAVWWIRQAILKALAEQGRVTHLPMSQLGDWRKLEKETAELGQELGRAPTLRELTASTDFTAARAHQALAAVKSDLSLDAPCFAEGDESRLDSLFALEEGIDEALEKVELAAILRQGLASLDEREQAIVRAYFGLGREAPMTLQEIGAELGLTRERVRQLRNAALEKIRRDCRELLVDFDSQSPCASLESVDY